MFICQSVRLLLLKEAGLGVVCVYLEKNVSMRPVIWCGGECLRSFGINGIGWKVFFLRNSTKHSKNSIRSRCVCSCMYGDFTPPLPSHHHKTPSSRLFPHLYIPSPVSLPLSKPLQWMSGKDGAISACVSSVCVGPQQPVCSIRWACLCAWVTERKWKDYG